MLALRATGALPVDAVWTAELPVLLAASAAQQAASPTARRLTSYLRGQGMENDPIHVLAQMFGPSRGGVIDAACLCGSFHPAVAGRLTVGKE